ncbi:MAG: universal stress protein [Polyangiales bacterium]
MTQDSPEPETAPTYVILVAVTFDKTGMQALTEAVRLSQLHPSSQLHVVHVIHERGSAGPRRDRVPTERRLELSPAELKEYVAQVCAEAPSDVQTHVRAGVPSRAILRTAAEIKAELVVVGAHRRSGVKKLVRGSVAEQVFQHSHCPVFIAVPKDYADRPVQPPQTVCPRCMAVRQRTYGGQLWCERHERARTRPPEQLGGIKLPDRTHYHP